MFAQSLTQLTGIDAHRLMPIMAALLLGSALVLVVGFASTEVVHNAAHDTRHASGFPCH